MLLYKILSNREATISKDFDNKLFITYYISFVYYLYRVTKLYSNKNKFHMYLYIKVLYESDVRQININETSFQLYLIYLYQNISNLIIMFKLFIVFSCVLAFLGRFSFKFVTRWSVKLNKIHYFCSIHSSFKTFYTLTQTN